MTAAKLTFDPATHIYKLGGRRLPSVTQILRAAGIIDYSMIPQDVLLAAAERGTAVHRACELLDHENPWTLPHEWAGYLTAYEAFKRDSGFTPASIEQRVCREDYGYAGTLDRTGYIGEHLVLLDLKTGVYLPGFAYQIAAYNWCLAQPRRYRRMVLQLHREGAYRVHEFEGSLKADVDVFLAALEDVQAGKAHIVN